jgi:hypothetical protein
MQIEQTRWRPGRGWVPALSRTLRDAHLVLLFGGTDVLKDPQHVAALRQVYPEAHLLGCATSGEIYDTQVTDDTLVATAVRFESTAIKSAAVAMDADITSFAAGQQLAQQLNANGLVHVFVLANGLSVNGSELVAGLVNHLPPQVAVTGGLSGDGARFSETMVFSGNPPRQHIVAAIGLYGDRLRVGYGSLGGWDAFGPERLITRASGNILYELDGTSALRLYKTYLGEYARDLPSSGLLFPLSLRTPDSSTAIVRAILAVDEEAQSMTFAGDMYEGAYARLMKANFDRLVVGAKGAAMTSYEATGSSSPELAVLISCVGRKLVLKQRTEEEVEGVRNVLGDHTVLTGFYSYGEISPFTPGAKCELHNQTMTITTFAEQ